MKARGRVFLDYESADLRRRDGILAPRFGGFAEITLALIGGEFVIGWNEDSLASDIILASLECTAA